MTKKERYEGVVGWFSENVPVAESELHFRNPYQLIVAVILSAQCTDRRVNLVTPGLFTRFPDAETMAAASPEAIYPFIRSVSYPNNKARHLHRMARTVVSDFRGEIPRTTEALQLLPGVGRKTANVVASILYGAPVIAVDTHVFRVARRTGLSAGKTPLAVERDLTAGIPAFLRPKAHHWLILHGRYCCTARSPRCGECGIAPWCRTHARSAARSRTGNHPS